MEDENRYRNVPELKNRKMKEEAVSFYAQHNVRETLENLLNAMFPDKPEDVYGYMSEYFHRLSKAPAIDTIEGQHLIDEYGDTALSLTMHCIINGVSKPIHTYTHSLWCPSKEDKQNQTTPQNKPTGKLSKGEQRNSPAATPDEDKKETSKVLWISPLDTLKTINKGLTGTSPSDHNKVDDVITMCTPLPDSPEGEHHHPGVSAALSRLSSLVSSHTTKTPLFLHLSQILDTGTKSYAIPLPVVSLVAGGLGKLKIRGICLSPSQSMNISEGVQHLVSVYREVGRILSAKYGVRGMATVANGAYLCECDKLEQLLDLVRDAATNIGLGLNREIYILVDVGGESIYDEDKSKYELSVGQWKSAEEMATVFGGLIAAYPGLIGYIDPVHSKDANGWQVVTEKLQDSCLLISDQVTQSLFPAQPLATDLVNDTATTSADEEPPAQTGLPHIACTSVLSTHLTLTHCGREAKKLRGVSRYLMFNSVEGPQTFDSLQFNVDLAVALHCKFIRLAAPSGIATAALSRLLQIQKLLDMSKLRKPSSALMFSSSKAQQ